MYSTKVQEEMHHIFLSSRCFPIHHFLDRKLAYFLNLYEFIRVHFYYIYLDVFSVLSLKIQYLFCGWREFENLIYTYLSNPIHSRLLGHSVLCVFVFCIFNLIPSVYHLNYLMPFEPILLSFLEDSFVSTAIVA